MEVLHFAIKNWGSSSTIYGLYFKTTLELLSGDESLKAQTDEYLSLRSFKIAMKMALIY